MLNLKKQSRFLIMSRSLYKLPFLNREVIVKSLQRKNRKTITFYQRNSLVPFCFVRKVLSIYQGSFFKSYNYYQIQLGLCLGQFTFTRRKPKHKIKVSATVKKRVKNKNKVKVLNFTKKGFFSK